MEALLLITKRFSLPLLSGDMVMWLRLLLVTVTGTNKKKTGELFNISRPTHMHLPFPFQTHATPLDVLLGCDDLETRRSTRTARSTTVERRAGDGEGPATLRKSQTPALTRTVFDVDSDEEPLLNLRTSSSLGRRRVVGVHLYA